MRAPHIDIKSEIDEGNLIVRGSVHIYEYDLCFIRHNIFDHFKKMDIAQFREYLSSEYLWELEKYLDKTTDEAKKIIMATTKERILRIFALENDKNREGEK